MENPVYFGLMLMIIGMTTVFAILFFVVMGGRLTIFLTNKFEPAQSVAESTIEKSDVSKIAAITAAVESLTDGRGHITEIKKINK